MAATRAPFAHRPTAMLANEGHVDFDVAYDGVRCRALTGHMTADGLAAATTAAIPQTTGAREGTAPRGRRPARLAAWAAVPWTG